jgi:hypothetical protein
MYCLRLETVYTLYVKITDSTRRCPSCCYVQYGNLLNERQNSVLSEVFPRARERRTNLQDLYGLPTPIGCLDIYVVLSFQSGNYQDLSNLSCLATTITKLHSTPSASYTVITSNEVDNHHHNSQYPSKWTTTSNRGAPPPVRGRLTTLS